MRPVKSFAFAAVLLLSSALSAAAQSAREDIEAALPKFTDAFNSGNAAAVGQLYTEDAALLPPDGKRVDGRKGVEEFWQGAIKGGMKNLTLKALEVEESATSPTKLAHLRSMRRAKTAPSPPLWASTSSSGKRATTGHGACIGTSGI
ncbi:nuclear transport factor 2 family protein [Mesorhizobium sp.]|uniref:YybH family protein n=1 Tax=Mesorhizobium sp. TaxID=1871066 RepID=UPI0025895051|nr:nuclear transport factor 2 family protein [Mesorhizobium sp.]